MRLTADDEDNIPPFMPPPDLSDDEDEYDPYVYGLTVEDFYQPHRSVSSAKTSLGITVTAGECGELVDGDFVFIQQVSRRHVTGTLLQRSRRVDNMLHKRLNEVCAILRTPINSEDPLLHDCPITRPLDSVVAKRDIIFTNRLFPTFRFSEEGRLFHDNLDIEERALLVCRWKRIVRYDSTSSRVVHDGSLVRLREHECTKKKGISDVLLKRLWKPSAESNRKSKNSDAKQNSEEDAKKAYAYIDLFTGAGGMAEGASKAGLKPKLFLDKDKDACKTLRLNHHGVKILCNAIWDLFDGKVSLRTFYHIVDIVHVSFPCNYYSPAHTREGKNDLDNIAAAFSVINIINMFRPRILTFEQTYGILTKEGGQYFSALTHQLTVMDYSVRWEVVNCAEYSNAHSRKRLIVIAACPGEMLPPMPEKTHGDGRLPFTTINDSLAKIDPMTVEPHMQAFTAKNEAPYDGNQPLRSCITTGGGEGDLHPSGERSFNLQELAVLQSFAPTYRFAPSNKTSIRRQIGNAVPSCLAEALFKSIIETLKISDQLTAEWKPELVEID